MRKWIRRIVSGLGIVLLVALAGLAVAIRYESDCDSEVAAVAEGPTMKAVTRRCYGSPDVLAVEDIPKPVPNDYQLLVRVRAAAINPLEWHKIRGTPYAMRIAEGFGAPKDPRLGIDFAGVVEAVGSKVTKFKPGDEIFGGRDGALAEYIVVRESGSIARKPANVSFEQAASTYVAALTALQALRDRAAAEPGHKVLINGASGGVGTFAVQIAKWLGAEVTGVCSTRNVELVRSLGADHVIDYTQQDFTTVAERFDVVMDNVANRPILDIRRILKPQGKYLVIGGGGPDEDPWLGAFRGPIKAFVISWFVDEDMAFFLSHASTDDLVTLAQLMQEGKITPVVDRRYRLVEVRDAIRYLETGRARGKVVLVIGEAT
jgi:NADPH:quinone reductase-like Zn-dependent oxidoreductase